MDTCKMNAVISNHNWLGLTQALSFLDSIIPFNRTLKRGGILEKEPWQHTMVFLTVVLKPIQDIQCSDAEMASNDALVWGSLRATDIIKEFRHYPFVEDPRICSFLSLTSMVRERSAVADLHKELEALTKTMNTIEDQRKASRQKNPNFKW